MKNLKTGEITPPLPHDEYTRQWEATVAAEQKDKGSRRGNAPSAVPAAPAATAPRQQAGGQQQRHQGEGDKK